MRAAGGLGRGQGQVAGVDAWLARVALQRGAHVQLHDTGRRPGDLGPLVGRPSLLGQVLVESMDYNRGNLENANLLDYRTLSPKQMPQVEVILVETNDPEGPFGAKEAGEGPLLPILPAVANAIYDAIGVRF